VVVDDVQKHHQSALMSGVDQGLQIVGPAVTRIRRVEQHAVIAPVPAARKIGERHELQCGDAGFNQMVELCHHCAIRAVLGERADMRFKENALFPRAPFPVRAAPRE
jgi:hypothetical protein